MPSIQKRNWRMVVVNETERKFETIFVVMDPTQMVQSALEKAERIAARNDAKLHLYCCIWEDVDRGSDAGKSVVEHTSAWLDRLATTSRDKGLDVAVEVDWDSDWRGRIATVASDRGADLIVKAVARHSVVHRQLMRTSDWVLLRNSSCPTLLIDPKRPLTPKTVLAAVKLRPGSDTHELLNQQVLATAHRISAGLGADLHAATVYKGDYFDRQRFADSCGLPRNRVHALEGSARAGIAKVAEEVGADLLVIGCAVNQAPERRSIIGDTAQRVIDEVDTDIIVVPAA